MYSSLNELLVKARLAEIARPSEPPGRARGSHRIKLEVRRARQRNAPGSEHRGWA
jgi:hypothetical protein